MKALKIKLYQPSACYRKPYSNKTYETYPLPPYSTVKGMIHKILNVHELVDFGLSIQGNYEDVINDYQTMQNYKKSTKQWETCPRNKQMLTNVHLIIHVTGSSDILEKIQEELSNTGSLSLGSNEDVAYLEETPKIINVIEDKSIITLKYGTYIPKVYIKSAINKGCSYNLCWTYKILNGIREWNKIDSKYLLKGSKISSRKLNNISIDEDGDYIFSCTNRN